MRAAFYIGATLGCVMWSAYAARHALGRTEWRPDRFESFLLAIFFAATAAEFVSEAFG